jgi:hypothetical protein
MLRDSKLEPRATAGTIVYTLRLFDYGSAADDTVLLGKPYISVTLDPDGDYPFFTVPVDDVELCPSVEGGR